MSEVGHCFAWPLYFYFFSPNTKFATNTQKNLIWVLMAKDR